MNVCLSVSFMFIPIYERPLDISYSGLPSPLPLRNVLIFCLLSLIPDNTLSVCPSILKIIDTDILDIRNKRDVHSLVILVIR